MSSPSPGALRLALRPSMFLLHVPAGLAVVAAVLLGNWQLDAWQLHREDRTAALADATPRPLADVLGPDDPFPAGAVGQPVRAEGSWLSEETVHVEDRRMGGETGFWTVTPLEVDPATGTALPVVLGWSSTPAAPPSLPTGRTEVVGWLQPGEGAEPDTDPEDDVLPSLRIADLLQRLDQDLYGGYLVLESPAAAREGLTAVTPAALPKAPTFTALRNLLYAVEWWLFGCFAVFLWWRWTRDEIAAARAREDAVTSLSTDVEPELEDAAEPGDTRLPSGS